MLHELKCHGDYEAGEPISFWRSTSGYEVDFLIGEERTFKRLICVSLEARRRQVGDITILPYGQFLDRLWAGEYGG